MDLVTPELGTFIWMLLSFGIVLLILAKYAWKPILNALKEREQSIKDALSSAERAKEEMSELQADNERILQEARKERAAMLKEAKEMGSKLVSEAKQKATLEADKVIESARINIEGEKSAALNEIKAQVAILSVEIAEKILRQQFADDQQQKDYFKKLMDEVKLN
ncbi:F0F1 ATP synthase subunit B [Labilibaculum antarcticum]|uniref:ATP synthase subunit b n=1 Tax=Labilibaculum antarcticum TaxID=1717717 RepID=A0A1Y1CJG2_9BACT|nr:F0F1 ATP synthase subunit B [Labilibaculum antarcticum]BAX80122.1 ATP synthase F0 subunit B [Labilibaculum antarcticum]